MGKSYSVRRESAAFWFVRLNFSLLHHGIESANRLFDRRYGIVATDLVQVDMVGLQTAETGLHSV
jgi:hypothetical protein